MDDTYKKVYKIAKNQKNLREHLDEKMDFRRKKKLLNALSTNLMKNLINKNNTAVNEQGNLIKKFHKDLEANIEQFKQIKNDNDYFHNKYNDYITRKEEKESRMKEYIEFKSHEIPFIDIIKEYKAKDYKIPDTSTKKNLFEASSLLMENNKIIDYLDFSKDKSIYNKDLLYMNKIKHLCDDSERHFAHVGRKSHIANANLFNQNTINNINIIYEIEKLNKTQNEIDKIKKLIKEEKFDEQEIVRYTKKNTVIDRSKKFNSQINHSIADKNDTSKTLISINSPVMKKNDINSRSFNFTIKQKKISDFNTTFSENKNHQSKIEIKNNKDYFGANLNNTFSNANANTFETTNEDLISNIQANQNNLINKNLFFKAPSNNVLNFNSTGSVASIFKSTDDEIYKLHASNSSKNNYIKIENKELDNTITSLFIDNDNKNETEIKNIESKVKKYHNSEYKLNIVRDKRSSKLSNHSKFNSSMIINKEKEDISFKLKEAKEMLKNLNSSVISKASVALTKKSEDVGDDDSKLGGTFTNKFKIISQNKNNLEEKEVRVSEFKVPISEINKKSDKIEINNMIRMRNSRFFAPSKIISNALLKSKSKVIIKHNSSESLDEKAERKKRAQEVFERIKAKNFDNIEDYLREYLPEDYESIKNMKSLTSNDLINTLNLTNNKVKKLNAEKHYSKIANQFSQYFNFDVSLSRITNLDNEIEKFVEKLTKKEKNQQDKK